MNPNDLLPNGDMGDFDLLGNNYGIDDQGNMPKVDVTQQNIRAIY